MILFLTWKKGEWVTHHKQHTSGLIHTLLISPGSGAVYLPEHHIDDHVAEQKGHAASEPLDSCKLVPGMSSCNWEPQIILGELFYNHGAEQLPTKIHQNRKDMRFHSESALDQDVVCPNTTNDITTAQPLFHTSVKSFQMTDNMILLLF